MMTAIPTIQVRLTLPRGRDWLRECGIERDRKGFVLTGANGSQHPLETNRAGVFAIGDVRSGSTKRVAAAVGEGA